MIIGIDNATRGAEVTVVIVAEYNADTKQAEVLSIKEVWHNALGEQRTAFYGHERIWWDASEDEAWKDL